MIYGYEHLGRHFLGPMGHVLVSQRYWELGQKRGDRKQGCWAARRCSGSPFKFNMPIYI